MFLLPYCWRFVRDLFCVARLKKRNQHQERLRGASTNDPPRRPKSLSRHSSLDQSPTTSDLSPTSSHEHSVVGCCGSRISSGDRSKEIGHWVELIQRRSLRLADLRREFQGWQGSHERHCILHDVLLTPWPSPGVRITLHINDNKMANNKDTIMLLFYCCLAQLKWQWIRKSCYGVVDEGGDLYTPGILQ